MTRKIIHCDADCFYAAIEMRDNPALRNIPMAVGGSSDRRGVITTCNYIARRFGVRSAMATAQARRLCPKLKIIRGNMAKYKQASSAMREIFLDYSEFIEPLSLDEAFIDVTNSPHHRGSGTLIAEEIRKRISDKIGITVSAGVAPNKFLAKVASDWNKPDGIFVIKPDNMAGFVQVLPVEKIPGVGKVTAAKLKEMNLHVCADLVNLGKTELEKRFGRFGKRLFELASGIDERRVSTDRSRKSLSIERTYEKDLCSMNECIGKLPSLFEELILRLSKLEQRYKIIKAFVKVKFNNFNSTTLERIGTDANIEDYHSLLQEAIKRQSIPVRLIGLGVRLRDIELSTSGRQLELFPK